MKAIAGLLVIIGVGCLVAAAIYAIQTTPLTTMDIFAIGVAFIAIGGLLKG